MALKRLLIVDDDTDMSQMLAQHLGKEGFIVYTASNENQIREKQFVYYGCDHEKY